MSKTLFLLTFFLFFPTLNISGSFIVLQEIFLYAWAFIYYGQSRKIRIDALMTPFFIYLILLFLAISISAILTNEFYSQHDIYLLRSITQLLFAMLLFDKLLENDMQITNFAFWSVCIIAFPSIIAFLQVFDVLGMRTIIKDLYQPVYGLLDFELLSEFRSTSVFKDYFTASVYLSVIGVFIVALLIKIEFSRIQKVSLIIILILLYLSLLFVGRTGLVVIPIFLLILMLFSIRSMSINKVLIITFSVAGFLFIIINYLYVYYSDELSWAFEVFTLFENDETTFSSFDDMGAMNNRFIEYILNDLSIFLLPHHTYDLSYTKSHYYTDNFYLQELYRYGIYGLLALLVFYIAIIKKTIKYPVLFVISMMLIILNFKGGNTWLMMKNIYIYAFIFIFVHKVFYSINGEKK